MVKKRKVSSGKSKVKKVNDKFEEYEVKIDRLRELERELKVLDPPRQYDTEVRIIKSKLKDPTALPEIERRIKKLKSRMVKKIKKKSPYKKLENKIDDIDEHLPKISSKIKNLEKNIFEKNLESHKKIQKEIVDLKKSFEEKEKKESRRPDSSVHLLVEEKYNDFVNSLKQNLSDKEKKDEEIYKENLKRDFLQREKDLELKYERKIQDLKDAYDEKVKVHLQKEVESKFNEKVDEKVLRERLIIAKHYSEKEKEILNHEHAKLLNEFKKEKRKLYTYMSKEFNSRMHQKIREIEARVEGEKKEFHLKVWDKFNDSLKKEVARKERALRDKLHNDFSNQSKKHIEEQRRRLKEDFDNKLQKELDARKKELEKKYNSKISNVKVSFENKNKALESEKDKLLHSIIKEKNEISKQKAEFRRRADDLKGQSHIRELALEKIKKNLETQREILGKKENALSVREYNIKKEVEDKQKSLDEEFLLEKKKEEVMLEQEKANLKKQLEAQFSKLLKSKIEHEKKLIREKLHKEFELKMKAFVAQQRMLSKKNLEASKYDNNKKVQELREELEKRANELKLAKEKVISDMNRIDEENRSLKFNLIKIKHSSDVLEKKKNELEQNITELNKERARLLKEVSYEREKVREILSENSDQKEIVKRAISDKLRVKSELAKQKEKDSTALDIAKKKLEKELRLRRIEEADVNRKIEKEKKILEIKLRKEKQEKIRQVSQDLHKKLHDELSKKENEIRQRLENEFAEKLRESEKKHREDLEKRKSQIESEVKKRILGALTK